MLCILSDTIPEKCAEFFEALNDSGMKISKLDIQGLTDQAVAHAAVGLHGEAVGCAFERMLNVNRTLKVLNIRNCKLDTAVATRIAAGLERNTLLAELDIGLDRAVKFKHSPISIPKEGCMHVFKALCNNTSLKTLDVSGNKLGMEGSVALAEMLSCNKSLTELSIGGCRISKAGLREIARGLLQNTSLKTLKVWSTYCKTLLETEIERLETSQDFTPQSLGKVEIKAVWQLP